MRSQAAAEYADPASLVPWENNPRVNEHAVESIMKSITEFGFAAPIVARVENREIIAGHTRWQAAKRLGLKSVPVRFIDITREKAHALAIADNRLGELADWDADLLEQALREIEQFDELLLDTTGWGDGLDELYPDDSIDDAGESDLLFSTEQQKEAAFDHFRARGFPYRDLPLHIQMREINTMRAKSADSLLTSKLGYHVADSYHPHRFHATVKGKISPIDCFHNDAKLRKAIALSYDFGGSGVGADWIGGISMAAGTQACANFRPGFAAYLYRKHCPKGGTVLDTSTGYGGRMLGFITSAIDGLYIGIDPNVPTYEGNKRMAERLGLQHLVELINSPAEDVAHDLVRGRCDFAFTSPPYFTKEHYSEDDTQSWKRYPEADAWRDGFLLPMMSLQFAALKPGSTAIVNIANVKIGTKEYDCVGWTKEAASSVGFEYVRTDGYRLTANFLGYDKDQDEPVLVFRKPEASDE
jgi:hypothetical protein